MNIHFSDVKDVFNQNLIWDGAFEMCWYEMAWEALGKEGLLENNSSFDYNLTHLRPFTLLMLYSEFCQVKYEEVCYYDFYKLLEHTDVTDFNLVLIAGMILEKDVLLEHFETEDYNQILIEVADAMRDEVFRALVKHIGQGSVSLVYASMAATNWDGIEIEDDLEGYDIEIESELIELGSADDVCEKYKRTIEIYAEDILSMDDFNSAEAFEWISSGTYRLEEH